MRFGDWFVTFFQMVVRNSGYIAVMAWERISVGEKFDGQKLLPFFGDLANRPTNGLAIAVALSVGSFGAQLIPLILV